MGINIRKLPQATKSFVYTLLDTKRFFKKRDLIPLDFTLVGQNGKCHGILYRDILARW